MASRWQGWLSRHSRVLGGLFAAYWLLMFLATHLPMPHVESAPRFTDKVVHLVMYAGFTFLLSLWIMSKKPESPHLKWLVLGTAVVYAALDELLQVPLESRSADVWDFMMDVIGAALGLLLFAAVRSKLAWLWATNEEQA
jgi:VanZ family protein